MRLVFILLVPITMIIITFPYYIGLQVVLALVQNPAAMNNGQPEALSLVEQADLYAQHGMIEEAMAAIAEAQNIDTDLNISASSWNTLCWYGSLWGYASEVMDACENAVELAPDSAGIRDSRGLARALAGDYTGAIEDFEGYVEWLKNSGGSDREIRSREQWIVELEAGRNPFDEATLDELR